MSAGVSVAYFASIALLVLAATQEQVTGVEENPTSYFDTVVFLTMFLLAGEQVHPRFCLCQRLILVKAVI